MKTYRFKWRMIANIAYMAAITAFVILVIGSVGAFDDGGIGLMQCALQTVMGGCIAYICTLCGLYADRKGHR